MPLQQPDDDTSPAAMAVLIEGYRQMTPAQRLRAAVTLTHAVQTLAGVGIALRHPGLDAHELKMRLGSLWLQRRQMIDAFGWDPAEHGLG